MKSYKGEYEGKMISSMYPNLYRVRYRASIAGRAPQDIDDTVTALDEYHARERCSRTNRDIRGGITVEFLKALSEVPPGPQDPPRPAKPYEVA